MSIIHNYLEDFFARYNGLNPNTTDEERDAAIAKYQRSGEYMRVTTNFAPIEKTIEFIDGIKESTYIIVNLTVELSVNGYTTATDLYVHRDEVKRLMEVNKDNEEIIFKEASNSTTKINVNDDSELLDELMRLFSPSPLRN